MALVCSVAVATAFVHWRLRVIDDRALELADSAGPSIERLASARGDLRHLRRVVREEERRRGRGEPPDTVRLRTARDGFDQALAGYVDRRVHDGEQASVVQAKRRVDDVVTRYLREAARGHRVAATAIADDEIPVAIEQADAAITLAMESSARRARGLFSQVREIRTTSMYVAPALVIACGILVIACGILVGRAARAHAELALRQKRLDEERASQLDVFAEHVARDLAGSLGTVAFALELARGGNEEQRRRVIDRGAAALGRVKLVTSRLLEFAQAGEASSATEGADVARTLAGLVAELAPAVTEARAELSIVQERNFRVACSSGVLGILIGNLIRDALDNLGDASRRVELRVIGRRRHVRVEVASARPSSVDLDDRAFEPYAHKASSLGLGLATVKKLAHGHGGRVGVRSSPRLGTTFWFELPKATPHDAMPDLPPVDGGETKLHAG